MDELEKLMKESITVLNSIASSINAVKDGQEALQRSVDTIQASGKSGGSSDDDDEEDEDKKAMNDRIKKLEEGLKQVGEDVKGLVDCVKFIGEQVTGKDIDLENEPTAS